MYISSICVTLGHILAQICAKLRVISVQNPVCRFKA